ncbi:hypothetical protein CVT26_000758 [Gymnopilus dilepis]|uniref:Uncharacterized protein n=1 Tax=Gymnopilus dilepis TaxID=231916 RepID=A0A409Y2N1_9AGAR|nr:hypothetical protein CVT26_000758 [Gymnopilus dilepis]
MASDSGAQAGSSGQAVFHRLVLSLSGRSTPVSPSAAPPAVVTTPADTTEAAMPVSASTEPEEPATGTSVVGEPLQRVASASSSIKKARSKIANRLKQLGKDITKLRRGSSKSVPASPRVTVGEVSAASGAPVSEHSGHAKLLSMVAEQDEPEGTVRAHTNADADDTPSAMTLAKRIQGLIDALPFPTSPRRDIPVPKNPSPPEQDSDGHPIFPPNTTPIKDSNLISFLSSPTIMNGSTTKGRPSIWTVLEALGVPPHGLPPKAVQEDVEGEPGSGSNQQQPSDSVPSPPANPHPVLSDNTSVLLYSPLFPSAEDLVELGEQVPITVDEVVTPTSWTSVWPLSLWYGGSAPAGPGGAPNAGVDSQGRVVEVRTVQAWVPSTTKLSVQALWWGYRLYLPPPVLASLGDETLEATKRAAMITTALTWFFNNLPVSSLPAALQPAALLLQRLAPYLGYIGTFISWSWSTIKSYDVGYGVILSATWLLPVALIPGTWKSSDFPTSPSQGTPAPLPAPTPSSPPTSLPTTPSSPPTSVPTSPTTTPSSPPPTTSPTPTPSSPAPASPTPTTPAPTPQQLIAQIPVPPTPPEDSIPPVPPVPQSPAVPPDSPLGEQLLHGPLISPVPLPDENAPAPEAQQVKWKGVKKRTKALFTRSPKV